MAGEGLALMACLCFVISNVLFKKTETAASPLFINLVRTGIGIVTFAVMAIVMQVFALIFELSAGLWVIIIISFIFGQVIGDTAYFIAQKSLGVTKALTIAMTFPFFTYLFAILFLNRSFQWDLVGSLGLITGGVYLISVRSSLKNRIVLEDQEHSDPPSSRAIFWAFGASLSWAIGLILTDYFTNAIHTQLNIGAASSILGNLIRFPAAFVLLAILYRHEQSHNSLHRKTRATWGWLILGALIGTSVGAFLYTEAARIAGATVMAILSSTNPLFAIPLAYLGNHEKITLRVFCGMILTVGGILVLIL